MSAEVEPAEIIQSSFDAGMSWLSSHATSAFVVVLFLLLIQTVRLFVARGAAARRMARSRDLGARAEKKARGLLHAEGYRLEEQQVGGSYSLMVDGRSTRIHLRADYIVSQAGHTYVAEVKGGVESAKVTGRSTRRQLLEYLFAFEIDGVLLVDMNEETIHRVEFPELTSGRRSQKSVITRSALTG